MKDPLGVCINSSLYYIMFILNSVFYIFLQRDRPLFLCYCLSSLTIKTLTSLYGNFDITLIIKSEHIQNTKDCELVYLMEYLYFKLYNLNCILRRRLFNDTRTVLSSLSWGIDINVRFYRWGRSLIWRRFVLLLLEVADHPDCNGSSDVKQTDESSHQGNALRVQTCR